MKKVSVTIACYNEEDNVDSICEQLIALFKTDLKKYDYEIIFIDNDSKDDTRNKIARLCEKYKKVKAIFNAKNFGQFNSPYYAMLQSTGDCVIPMCCDFQDPLELLPVFLNEWEKGYKIVCGIKSSSRESKILRFLRTCYYKLIKKMSHVEQIEHFAGFGLYDCEFIEILKNLDDPSPFLRGIVAELGFKRKDIEYVQPARINGKSSNNWYTLYDAAMLSFTSYTKIGLRIATIFGFVCSLISLVIAIAYTIMKLCNWYSFPVGIAPILIGIFLFGSLQIFFIGLVGEYILNINTRIMHRPLVIEERRINFE